MKKFLALILTGLALGTNAQQVLLYGSDEPFSSLQRDSVLVAGHLFQKLHYDTGRLIFRSGFNEDSIEVTETFIFSGDLLTHCELMVGTTGETIEYRHILESGKPILGIRDKASKALAPLQIKYEYDDLGRLKTEQRLFEVDSMNASFRYHYPDDGSIQITRLNADHQPLWVEDRILDEKGRIVSFQRRKVGEKRPFLFVVALREE